MTKTTQKQPVSRKPEIVQARILDAAEAEFIAHGFEGASTNRIQVAFGGSKPTLFRHFPTKRDLFHAVVHRLVTQGPRLETDRNAEPSEWLYNTGLAMVRWALSPSLLFLSRFAIAEGDKFPEIVTDYVQAAYQPKVRTVGEQLSLWMADGRLSCADCLQDAADFLDICVSPPLGVAHYRRIVDEEVLRVKPHVRNMVTMFLASRETRQ